MNPKMGLLGGGDTTASGWGQPPASGSSASWGSSPGGSNSTSSGWNSTTSVSSTNHWGNNGHQTNGETNESSSSSSHSAYPKHSWAQAVCINRGPNQTQVPNYSGSCNSSSTSSRSHVENSSDIHSKYPTSSSSTSNEQQQHDSGKHHHDSGKHHHDSGKHHHDSGKHHHESSNRVLPTEVLIADNWGHAVINQEKSWDLPPSPHEQCTSESEWKSSSAAGTEIWENTVRQKVKGSSAQTSSVNSSTGSPSGQPSWTHAPTTHIGGTWGEEEDASIVWTGVPQPNGSSSHASSNSNASNGSQNGACLASWGGSKVSMVSDAGDSSVAWKPDPGLPRDHDQQGRNSQNKSWSGPSWGDPSSSQFDPVPAPAKLSALNMSSSSSTHSEHPSQLHSDRLGSVVCPDRLGSVVCPDRLGSVVCPDRLGSVVCPDRLGTVVWGGDKSPVAALPITKPTESIIRPVRDIPGTTGWEDDNSHFVPMPEKQRQMASLAGGGGDGGRDDGTAVWGNPQRQQKVSRWKEEQELLALQQQQQSNAKMPAVVSANGNSSVPSQNSPGGETSPGMIRLTPNAPIVSKPMNDSWIKSQQQAPQQPVMNRSPWNDSSGGLIPTQPASHRDVTMSTSAGSRWAPGDGGHPSSSIDKSRVASASGWGEAHSPDSYGGWGGKPKSSNSWSDGQIDTSSWGGPKQKPLSKEMILASKQFRVLTETGYKKDDVENALRSSNMNVEEALAELRSWASRDSSYPLSDGDGKAKALTSNTPTSLLTNGPNPSLPSISSNRSLSFGNQQQQLSQPYPSVNQVSSALRSQPSRGSTQPPLPSEKQLLHLVQQIQLAVQTGHLNAQILNQPLAPPTIQLIYQLLQSIKHLQNLQLQVATQLQSKTGVGGGNGGWNSSMQSQLHVQITQAKQRISNLQNQIAVNQAMYMKQTQPPSAFPVGATVGSGNIPSSPVGGHPNSTLDFKPGSDSSPLSSDFRDLTSSLKQDSSQSRLKTTWKLPTFDNKDSDQLTPSNDSPFSRAPGSTVPKTSSAISVLPRPDPTWSNDPPSSVVGGWSDGSNHVLANEVLKSESNPMQSMPSFVSELSVPEFEPGKPWKGTSQLKNFDDDPHVTPGSVNRSPLSVNASQLFNNWGNPTKVSPTEGVGSGVGVSDSSLSSLALSSSSTWAYNPSATTLSNSFGSDKGNGNSSASKTWSSFGENNDSLWSAAGGGSGGTMGGSGGNMGGSGGTMGGSGGTMGGSGGTMGGSGGTMGGLPSGSGTSATKPRGPPPPGLSELRGQQQQVTGDGSDVNPASVQSLMCLLNNLLVGGSGPSDNQQE